MAPRVLSLVLAALCASTTAVTAIPAAYASMPATLNGRSLKLRSMRAPISLNPRASQITFRLTGANLTANGLEVLTHMSSDVDTAAQNINVFNAAFKRSQVAAGLDHLVARIPNALQDLSGMAPLSAVDAVEVIAVLRTFVDAHQAMLNTVIGKHALLSFFGLAKPVRAALVALEAAVDRYTCALIELLPTRHTDGVTAKSMLDISIQTAILVYSQ